MLQNFRLAKEQWKQYQGKIQEYLEDIWSPDASEDQDTPSELAGKEFKKRASWYTRCFIPKAKMAFQSATTDAPVEADEELSSEDEDQPGVVQFRPNSMVGFHSLNLFKKDIDVDTVLRPKYCGLRQWDHPDFELANRPLEDDRIEQLTALVTDYAPNIPSYEAFTSFS